MSVPGHFHTRVQVQGVCVWELLRHLLIHAVPTARVGPGLVPGPQQGRSHHEGEPGEENQTLLTLRPPTHWRWVTLLDTTDHTNLPNRTTLVVSRSSLKLLSILKPEFVPVGLTCSFKVPRSIQGGLTGATGTKHHHFRVMITNRSQRRNNK